MEVTDLKSKSLTTMGSDEVLGTLDPQRSVDLSSFEYSSRVILKYGNGLVSIHEFIEVTCNQGESVDLINEFNWIPKVRTVQHK